MPKKPPTLGVKALLDPFHRRDAESETSYAEYQWTFLEHKLIEMSRSICRTGRAVGHAPDFETIKLTLDTEDPLGTTVVLEITTKESTE